MVPEKTLKSPLDSQKIKPVNHKRNQPLIFIWRIDGEAEAPILWPHDAKSGLTGKKMLGKIEDIRRRGWQRIRWLDVILNRHVWAHSRRLWRTGKPGVLQSMGSQRVGHDLATEQQMSGRRGYRTKGCRVRRVQASSFSQLYLKPIFMIIQLMLNFVCFVLASLVAQKVKNLPAMQETWVGSLGWDDPLEKGMATHFSILAWRIPMDRGAWQATVHRVTKSSTWLSD